MDTSVWTNSVVVHIAFVVENIEVTLDEYCKIFHMEKPMIKLTGVPETAQVKYNGNESETRAKQAFIQLGNLRIEFLEPDENDSTWREYLEKNGEGFHHVGMEIENMEATLKELSENEIGTVQSGKYKMGQYAYVSSERKLKMMLELLENQK